MSQAALKISQNHSEMPREIAADHPLRRKPALDGIRGLSAMAVMCFHYFYQMPLPEPLKALVKYGWTGVDMFFVLSGYLIATILLHHQKSPHLLASFYGRRFFRIIPLFYASIVLSFVLHELAVRTPIRSPVPYWSYFLLVNDVFVSRLDTMGTIAVAWSLAIEEKFYLVSPLVFRFFSLRGLVIVLIGVLGLSVVRQGWLAHLAEQGTTFYSSAVLRWEGICLGMIAAIVTAKHGESFWKLSRVRRYNLVVLVAAFGSMFLTQFPSPLSYVWKGTLYLRLALIYFSVLTLVLGFEGTKLTTWLGSRFLVWLGSISYGIYILHIPVRLIVMGLVNRIGVWEGFTKDLVTCSFAMALTLLVAHLSWRYFEKRFVDVSHRKFRY